MTDSVMTFFEKLPVNHWSSLIIAILSILFIVYSVYFYFSKEGNDERGERILSKASFNSFIITIALLFILNNFFFDIAIYDTSAYSWLLNLVVFIVTATECLSIFVLKKTI